MKIDGNNGCKFSISVKDMDGDVGYETTTNMCMIKEMIQMFEDMGKTREAKRLRRKLESSKTAHVNLFIG